jgi:hypothetical protein
MPLTDQSEAELAFNRLCPPDVCPELSDGEVYTILEANHRASLWTVSTLYELGAVVIPTLANRTGHRYRLVRYTDTATDQLSGTTEPTWTTSRDSEVTDNHVVWVEDGDDYDAVLWDIPEAAHAGWLLKASKASPTSDWQAGEMSIKSSQLFDHCERMAAKFAPFYVL